VFWEAVMERAGESPGGHEAALELATPVMRYSDIAATHASRAYVEYQQHLVADADRERRDLLEHLLAGELPTHRPLLTAAQSYGLSERTPTLVAAAMPVTKEPDAPHVAAEALVRAGGPTGRALVVRRQKELVVVAALRPAEATADAGDVCDRLQETQRRLRINGVLLAVGVGTVAAGIAELPRSYQEASSALGDVGIEGGVVALPRLSPFDYLALHADDTARRLVDPRLRTFLDEDRQRGGGLVETARVFAAADLNLRVAAERLQVHPNTAQYRLRRIEERTGRNPRRIADLVDLLVAIALLERTRTR
jgi:sugar diacid utilization regulator